VILGRNQMNYGTKQGEFLGQEETILGHNKTKFLTKLGTFGGRRS
jgi:hypothetical protein